MTKTDGVYICEYLYENGDYSKYIVKIINIFISYIDCSTKNQTSVRYRKA